MAEIKHVVIDVETGGLDDSKHPICQITASFLAPDLSELENYTAMVKPYAGLVIQEESLKANGLKREDIAKGEDIKVVVDKLSKLFVKYGGKGKNKLVVVGHNVMFDIGFVASAFDHCGDGYMDVLNDYVSDCPVDTMLLAKYVWMHDKDMRFRLADCCEKAGISVGDTHHSDVDVEITTELFRYFVGRLQSGGCGSEQNVKASYQRKFRF